MSFYFLVVIVADACCSCAQDYDSFYKVMAREGKKLRTADPKSGMKRVSRGMIEACEKGTSKAVPSGAEAKGGVPVDDMDEDVDVKESKASRK